MTKAEIFLKSLSSLCDIGIDCTDFLHIKKGKLYINLNGSLKAMRENSYNMKCFESGLKMSLKAHMAFVRSRLNHDFGNNQKRAWVFNTNLLPLLFQSGYKLLPDNEYDKSMGNAKKGSKTIPKKKIEEAQEPTVREKVLERRLIEVEQQLTGYKEMLNNREILNAELIALVPKIPPYFGQYEYVEPAKGKKLIIAALQLCDWQIGQTIKRRATGYFGHFNYNLAVARALYLTDEYIKWVKSQRNGYTINDGHVVVTGDMVNGMLKLSAAMSNEFPVPTQQVYAAALLAEVLNRIACHFSVLYVDYHVIDNHGRRTKKMQYTLGGENSDNYPVAELTKAYLGAVDNIKFNVHLEVQSRVEINGLPYLVEHGASVRSVLGYPWYGMGHKIGRESFKRMGMSMRKRLFDLDIEDSDFIKLIIGHYHAPLWHPQYLVGGSLPGTSEFDSAHGRHFPPCQTAFLVHPVDGEFNWIPFILTLGDRNIKSDNMDYIQDKYDIASPLAKIRWEE
jgi:hypothetical protein